MQMTVLGSSSAGNGYLLRAEGSGEVLLLEAGMKLSEVKRALDYDLRSIVGCLVTHEHGDHAKYAREYSQCFIRVLMTDGTQGALGLHATPFVEIALPEVRYSFGGFDVIPFSTQHDAEQPVGYLIRHQEMGTLLFATDTYYLGYTFPGLSNIMIECNYRLDILDSNIASGRVNPKVRDRIVKSHMSYDTCLDTLQANDLSMVNNIVLIHLSADNSHAEEFRQGIAQATGKQVTVAKKGLTINLGKTPY